ncbi:unnamed protein product [Angiostrongylus costaricensis]|uniref:RNB domain-containing protein n=1 Tax=Angiostrongylus costaricensis TaxID=334426 RepID=A0A3P7JQ85_ANGCS|nr:unnamed protein product [Angiostrongylus costaricensis]
MSCSFDNRNIYCLLASLQFFWSHAILWFSGTRYQVLNNRSCSGIPKQDPSFVTGEDRSPSKDNMTTVAGQTKGIVLNKDDFSSSEKFGGGQNYRWHKLENYKKDFFPERHPRKKRAHHQQMGSSPTNRLQGSIRINQRRFEEAFINNPDGSDFTDIAILGMKDRNRALHGDIVKSDKDGDKMSLLGDKSMQLDGNLEIVNDLGNYFETSSRKQSSYRTLSELPLEEWNILDSYLQKTAEVVGILERKHSRLTMGRLELSSASQRYWIKFSPTDSRIPRLMIAASKLPREFLNRPQDFSQILFIAKILEWTDDSVMAVGEIQKQLGPAGDISVRLKYQTVETEGLLATSDVDVREFPEEVISCLPSVSSETGWKMDGDEITRRRDLRDQIIFTIDPKTARDLDDALSIRPCRNIDGSGTHGWEVGVHIADVSYFVLENTPLDEWALNRATSVYLVDKVIPMLPRLLCEDLCSLNSGVDRLTFSVMWKMDDKGNVLDEWFGRTVIRSRVKLAYEHAQDFIENPETDFLDAEFPEISDGVTVAQIKEKVGTDALSDWRLASIFILKVLQLHDIARVLRRNRRQNGSLRLDQPKLNFVLDDETKLPIGVSVYEVISYILSLVSFLLNVSKESNHLVEEFMLLANLAVARKIERHYPETALLRSHPPPKEKVLRDAIRWCNLIGFPISGTSSLELCNALAPFHQKTQLCRSINQVLSLILMKAMEVALYFCAGTVQSQASYHHYALNVPLYVTDHFSYTHFTSPIRRYPDIVVHRLLAAALNYCEPSEISTTELEIIAKHCNDKRLIAKRVWESSGEIYFCVMVQRVGPIEARGVVVNVLDAAFDVLILKYGVIKRVYVKALQMSRDPIFEEASLKLTLFWQTDKGVMEQLIQLSTLVDVVLTGLREPMKYEAIIRPKSSQESPTLFQLWCEEQKSSNSECDNNVDLI